MTARERYLAILTSWPHWTATSDAIVLLAGDGEGRVDMAVRMMLAGAGQTLVITGGLDNPPYSLTARTLRAKAMGAGGAPSKIVVDGTARNTREQAVNVLRLAHARGWRRLTIVASPDHAARAHLTFIRALDDNNAADVVLVVPVVSWLKWSEVPAGRDVARLELFTDELGKVEQYAEHVATWERGVEYLMAWEARI